jgi:sulfide:quinone oxidoreductase
VQISGLMESLHDPDSQVCSIYGPDTVSHVYEKIKKTRSGNAIFTFPNSPVKCPGAPQKIAYITEDYFRKVCIIIVLR